MPHESIAAALATSSPDERGRRPPTTRSPRPGPASTRSSRAACTALDLLDAYDEAMAALGDTADRVDLIAVTHPDAAMRDAADAAKQAIAKVRTDISLDRGALRRAGGARRGRRRTTRPGTTSTRRCGRSAGPASTATTRPGRGCASCRRSWSASGRTSTATSAPTPGPRRCRRPRWPGCPTDYVRAHPAGDDGLVADHHRLPRLSSRS